MWTHPIGVGLPRGHAQLEGYAHNRNEASHDGRLA
jgi:hypothetical protein